MYVHDKTEIRDNAEEKSFVLKILLFTVSISHATFNIGRKKINYETQNTCIWV